MFVQAGGAVLLPEVPELQGAAMVDLVHRARTPEVGRAFELECPASVGMADSSGR